VDNRRRLLYAVPAQQLMLYVVLVVEYHDRHRCPVRRLAAPPPARERRGGGGHVAQRSKRLDPAPLHGSRIAGHGCEHGTAAQQLMRICLIFHVQPDRGAVPVRDGLEDTSEPHPQGVRVDRHRQLDCGGRAERLARLVVKQPGLASKPYQSFAVRRRPARRAAADQYLARRGLEGADALADRAWRDVQSRRGRFEAPVIGYGHERVDLARVQVHQPSEAQLNHR
jgi:hypothetical protein